MYEIGQTSPELDYPCIPEYWLIRRAFPSVFAIASAYRHANTQIIHPFERKGPSAAAWKADYKPFGEELITAATEENYKMFVGKEKDKETGLYYFGARYMQDKSARFVSIDPVGPVDSGSGRTKESMLQNPQLLNRYAYSLNNPYRFYDPDGKMPGAIFPSAQKAVKDALKFTNTTSIKENAEYAGMVCKNKKDKYFATKPVKGSGDSANPSDSPCPGNCSSVGDYHTHGDYSKEGPDGQPVKTSKKNDEYNSDHFSDTDKAWIKSDAKGYGKGYKGYLGTPSREFKVYAPSTNKESLLK